MAKITITIDGDNITVNQSAIPTKVEKENKKFFIIMRTDNYYGTSWVEFVSDDYSKILTKLYNCNNNKYDYKVLLQDEKGNIKPLVTLFGGINFQSIFLLNNN